MTGTEPHSAFHDEQAAWEALGRWLDGASPPEEADAVQVWLAADPARAALVQAITASSPAAAPVSAADVDVEAALRSVRARMEDGAVDPVPGVRSIESARRAKTVPARTTDLTRTALRIAAVLVLALGAGFLLRGRITGASRGLAEAQAYRTGTGERRTVDLPDGTRVLLGPGSSLTVAAGYGGSARPVSLAGEALFEVKHDAARPFAVTAGAARIEDLGTRFTVRAGPDAGVRVVVTEGSVRLAAVGAAPARGVVLRPGDRAEVRRGAVRPAPGTATDEDLAWTRGRLVFRDAPVEQVADELHRWYGIELRVQDAALARRLLTASFGNEPREEVLRVVALTLGAEVKMHGDTALLRPAGAPER
ncbi:MAG TPA: FecR domain-containing protein [Longimicrobiaceae bacterium]|nr:FecR domain-containing protein [Longimicrobiaceae bacterium]